MPGMTVLENIMLGLPKRTRFGLVDWPAIAREVGPIASRDRRDGAARRSRKGPFDRRELADQHHPRAGPQGAPDRHGRADRLAVGGGGGAAVRDHPRPCRLGRGGALRLASARRDSRPCAGASPCSATAARWPSSPAPTLTRRSLVDAIVGERRRDAVEARTRRGPRRGRAVRARAHPGAAGDRRQLRSASRRGARPRRPGRRRPQRARRG